ncbi:MAG: lytic transglycosylase domain-containing protein [Deltaproteobacteria bacterium]|nr:lytic transglycosylase domain-containing protein [Deltaproteobacteria bacterium]
MSRVYVAALLAVSAFVEVAFAEGDLSETVKYVGEYVPGDIQGLEKWIQESPEESLSSILFHHGEIKEDPYQTLGDVRLSADRLRPTILEAARTYDVPPALIDAVIRTESGYRPGAVSRTGARGLMQLMPGTAREMGVEDSFDPKQNIFGGTKYLKKMLDKFGTFPLAIAAYNAGPGAVIKHDGIPPFKETRGYVATVMFRYKGSPMAKEQYRFEQNDGRRQRVTPAPDQDDEDEEDDGDLGLGEDLMRLVR